LPYAGKRFAKRAISAVATFALGVGLFVGLSPTPGGASSHREAPLVAADPQVDSTDLYAFVNDDNPGKVNIITNWIPFEEPAGGPNFFAFAEHVNYDVNIDNNGDAVADVIYRWRFKNHYRTPGNFLYNTGVVTSLTDPDLNFYQTYTLQEIRGNPFEAETLATNVITVPSDVGDASMPNYAKLFKQGVKSIEGGTGSTWAGQSDDPFFLDLRVFDLLYGGDLSEVGDDTVHGFNVNPIALQVPMSDVAQRHNPDRNPVIGIWTTASRPSVRTERSDGTQRFSGPDVQVSRLGMPLVNEVVIPVGKKDKFSASQPANDTQFLPYVIDPILPHVAAAVYPGVLSPPADCHDGAPITRDCDLVPVFLTGIPGLNTLALNADNKGVTPGEMLRLNMSVPPCDPDRSRGDGACSRLGVLGGDNAGFPNGRRLFDDIIDIELRVAEGAIIPLFSGDGHFPPAASGLGDGVDANDEPFREAFPYVGLPWSGSDADPHCSGALKR
jgi:hypothetical protein